MGKLPGCERDLAINLLGCIHLLLLLSFIRKTKNAQLKNPTGLLHKNLMKALYKVWTELDLTSAFSQFGANMFIEILLQHSALYPGRFFSPPPKNVFKSTHLFMCTFLHEICACAHFSMLVSSQFKSNFVLISLVYGMHRAFTELLSLMWIMKVRSDRHSKFSNLSNWKDETWKKSGLQCDSNPWPPQYRYNALPTELWSHTLGTGSIYWVHVFPSSEVMWSRY